jgi:hypothetical protein
VAVVDVEQAEVEIERGADMGSPSAATVEMDVMRNKGVEGHGWSQYVGGLLSMKLSLGWTSTSTEIEVDMAVGVEVPRRAMASRSKTVARVVIVIGKIRVLAAAHNRKNPSFQPLPTHHSQQTPSIFWDRAGNRHHCLASSHQYRHPYPHSSPSRCQRSSLHYALHAHCPHLYRQRYPRSHPPHHSKTHEH